MTISDSPILRSLSPSPPNNPLQSQARTNSSRFRSSSITPISTLSPRSLIPSRFLRSKRPSTAPNRSLQTVISTPLARLTPRDEMASRPKLRERKDSVSSRRGMTVLSFLLLDDACVTKQTWAAASNQDHRDISVARHIIPPEELAKFTLHRTSSLSSFGDGNITTPLSSAMNSPTSPRLKQSLEVDTRPMKTTGPYPPPRPRPSPTSPKIWSSTLSTRSSNSLSDSGTQPPLSHRLSVYLGDSPSDRSHSLVDRSLKRSDSPSSVYSENISGRAMYSDWSMLSEEQMKEKYAERKRLAEWLAQKPIRRTRAGAIKR